MPATGSCGSGARGRAFLANAALITSLSVGRSLDTVFPYEASACAPCVIWNGPAAIIKGIYLPYDGSFRKCLGARSIRTEHEMFSDELHYFV